jgi:hypothetical protein
VQAGAEEAVAELRPLLPVISPSFIPRLTPLDPDGGSESIVYRDLDSGLVYKVTEARTDRATGELDGRLGGGYVPPHLQTGAGDRAPNLLDWLERHAVNNLHGGLVLAEALGVLPDGSLVTAQPFVPDLRPNQQDSEGRQRQLRRLNLLPVPGLMALGWADGRPAIFADLHADNVMEDAEGTPFIIDATSRWLAADEIAGFDEDERRGLAGLSGRPDS